MDGYESMKSSLASKEDIRLVLKTSSYSDYLLLTQIADNMETSLFCEFLMHLAKYRRDTMDLSDSGVETGDLPHHMPDDDYEKESMINAPAYPQLKSFIK